ncbi:glycoside hydrolase family 97 protein [Siphonobacter aquaeclarae]|uniref:Alpha-glucosidase n=1 Tax=Siphonobacter aquaeclarae TaxID=563176 RepID=A0A1G9L336_9BACT|nr:glycoside hydrolase family 97 protein [Siphonobacter aquaeclarae]SDL56206.1 alpha-glucosidase [Siphonobacter aquaeclarae]
MRRLLLLLLLPLGAFSQDSLRILSPNGKLQFRFSLLPGGIPSYDITENGQAVILPSRLGLADNTNLPSGRSWDKNLQVIRTARREVSTTWKPVWGERSEIPDRYRELTVTLRHADRDRGTFQVVARAYDEGVAFRYFFPEEGRTQILDLGAELTEFHLPEGTEGYWTERAQTSYRKRPLENWERDAEMPLTLRLPDNRWACIAQAEQTNYPRARLKTVGKNRLTTQLFGEVTETSPWALPWRVVLTGEKPGDILEHNYLILNLNPPNELKETAWIQPGKVMREVTLSTSGAKKLVDFAVEQNIEYIHFDAGWYGHEYDAASDATKVNVDPRRNPKNDLDLPAVIAYAKAKGKKVILYVNHRALERQLDDILPLYHQWGVAGIKFGFVHTGSHHWTRWLHDAIRKAARYNMVLDIHDEFRPSGFSRTYPNLLTQEGIRGNEEFPDATHNTVLPFTRFIAGAADYTFCFNEKRLKNTKAHQLAISVIYFSPLQYLYWYGKPEDYPNRKEVEFWKDLPTVWDDTRVLAGTPEEFVTVARRKGANWWIGLITNTSARKQIIGFGFLPKGKTYRAVIHEDDGNGSIRQRTETVTASGSLTFDLAPSGGVALRLEAR